MLNWKFNSNWGRLRSELALFESETMHPVCTSNVIGSSHESNPSRKICNLRAVPLGHFVDNDIQDIFRPRHIFLFQAKLVKLFRCKSNFMRISNTQLRLFETHELKFNGNWEKLRSELAQCACRISRHPAYCHLYSIIIDGYDIVGYKIAQSFVRRKSLSRWEL